jgi:hypothetical protein
MSGNLDVVPSSTAVASPQAQYAAGQKKLASDEKTLQSALAALRQGKPPIPGITLPGKNVVLAGSGSPASTVEAAITEFGKSKISIPVGGSVIWYLIGPHTITFNSDRTNDDVRLVAGTGRSTSTRRPSRRRAGRGSRRSRRRAARGSRSRSWRRRAGTVRGS